MENKSRPTFAQFLPTLIMVTLLMVMIGSLIYAVNITEQMVIHDIVSIERSDDMSGGFFLGTGSVNSQDYFYFYEKVGSGLVLKNVPAATVIIEERSDITPQYQECDPYVGCDFAENYKNKLIVPPGTVLREFKAI